MAALAHRSIDTKVRGIYLSSRYDKPHEIERMIHVVETMDLEVSCHIESIWCDSKASAFYFVSLKDSTSIHRTLYGGLPEEIAKAFASAGGYNGVQVSAAGKTFEFDPSWSDQSFTPAE